MNQYLEQLFARQLGHVIRQEPVPDEREELNWRLFLAHSQDMQGFAADIFIGGPDERRHPTDASFRGLRERWRGTSGELIADLGSVWAVPTSREALKGLTRAGRTGGSASEGVAILRASGALGAIAFADVLDDLSGPMVARKTNRMIRAYVQNSALLSRHGDSFRDYLASMVGGEFPPSSASPFETIARTRIEKEFFNVGPALANYLLSDWLLWLWREGRIEWFESYKADSVHRAAVEQGLLPAEAGRDFVAYSRSVRIPAGHGRLSGLPCPPRVLNACLWQDGNWSTGGAPATRPVAAPAKARVLSVPAGSEQAGVVTFRDDDLGYKAWLAAHPGGLVLNVERSPRAAYLKLHRAACHHIVDPIRRGQALTCDYIKICALERTAIEAWCTGRFGTGPQTGCYCMA